MRRTRGESWSQESVGLRAAVCVMGGSCAESPDNQAEPWWLGSLDRREAWIGRARKATGLGLMLVALGWVAGLSEIHLIAFKMGPWSWTLTDPENFKAVGQGVGGGRCFLGEEI